ncbi:MAG: DUF4340 domain-containing protein [Anaerolineae bacterium]|nr:DUF4340 domain-containing protein [Anaerolineae bacterium]NUQ02316.1 hypothetical protein [Anaerolineae bacterium]
MTQRRTGLLILMVVFVGLLLLTLAQPPLETSHQPLTPVAPFYRVFPDLAVLDIMAMRIRSPETDDTFTLLRNEQGEWQVADRSGTLEEGAGTVLARTMALLPYTSEMQAEPNLATYGFTPEGVLAIEIVLVDGGSHAVAVGFRTPTEQGYYAFVDDRPDLYILDRSAVDYLISQLRDPPVA